MLIQEELQKMQNMHGIQGIYGNPFFEPQKMFNEMNQPVFKNGLYNKFDGRGKPQQDPSNGLYFHHGQNFNMMKEDASKNLPPHIVNNFIGEPNSQLKNFNPHMRGNLIGEQSSQQAKYENPYQQQQLQQQDGHIKLEDQNNNSLNLMLNPYESLLRNNIMLENTRKKIKMA